MRSKQIQKETVEYQGDVTFADMIDFINPLQHIPIVSNIYRAVTGDEISTGARMAGGALFGGVIGFVAAGLAEAFEEGTGKTVETHIAELFSPGQETTVQQAAKAPALPAAPEQVAAAHMTPPMQVARQAPARFNPAPSAIAAQEVPQLDALDLSGIEAAKPAPLPLTDSERGKQDTILDLFGQHMSSVTDTYNKSQMLAYASQVASEMKA